MRKQLKFVETAILLLGISLVCANAQFYAPETEYHDKAQRLFPVEATRVLAWRENLHAEKIAEVTYNVQTAPDGSTSWDLQCLDETGKALKQLRVSYPPTLLTNGPEFYRNVFKQLWTQGKWTPAGSLDAASLNERFWEGAELTGTSRETGIARSFHLAGREPSLPDDRYAPSLAGLLIHTTLPSLAGGVTLDAVLLARGAAWLAFSESMLAEPGKAENENWAPVLFLSGREYAACSLWKDAVSQGNKIPSPLFQWWDFLTRRPTARAAFEFVANPKIKRWGMPMITYYSRIEGLGPTLSQVVILLYGQNTTSLLSLYDYGAFLEYATDVGGGRILEGAWPAVFRKAWLETLRNFPPGNFDYKDYVKQVEAIPTSDATNEERVDFSLMGLKEMAPLLELAHEQGVGKLNPVGSVTARDLLNYGWEMNGLQMGARHWFVEKMWGIPDLGDRILREANRGITGQTPFFKCDLQKQSFDLTEQLFRLQMVDDLCWRLDVSAQPFSKNVTDPVGARLFEKRCWLRPCEALWEAWTLSQEAGLPDEMTGLLERYHREGGPRADEYSLEYLFKYYGRSKIDPFPRLKQLRSDIGHGMIDPTHHQTEALYDEVYYHHSSMDRGKLYEKAFWQNPDGELQEMAFDEYVNAGAWKAAKRFYMECRSVVRKSVGFSNIMAPQAWMLGFLLDDEELMQAALEDSQTGSKASMFTAIWDSAAHENFTNMDAQLSELIERYESEDSPRSEGKMMKAFLPLIPALKDPQNPHHEEALDFFGASPQANNLRWVLIHKFKVSDLRQSRRLEKGGTAQSRIALRAIIPTSGSESKSSLVLCRPFPSTLDPLGDFMPVIISTSKNDTRDWFSNEGGPNGIPFSHIPGTVKLRESLQQSWRIYFELSPQDAIRFLGGNETDLFRRVLILYLRGDKPPMRQAFYDFVSSSSPKGAGRVAGSWVTDQLLGPVCPIDDVDLRPPDAKSIVQAVEAKLKQN